MVVYVDLYDVLLHNPQTSTARVQRILEDEDAMRRRKRLCSCRWHKIDTCTERIIEKKTVGCGHNTRYFRT